MNKPRILLSSNKWPEDYVDAITKTGGIAHAHYLPPMDTDYDGLLLCGGSDIDPMYYGEEMNGTKGVDKARDEIEFALLKAFVEAGKPVMGICRGLQLINIFFGGNLHQHLTNAEVHTKTAEGDKVHRVVAVEGSIAEKLYGTEFSMNSNHHQGVNKLGEGLKITMLADGGATVEGIEHTSLPIFAVQGHPERMCFAQRREDTVDGSEFFKHFVRMCQK